ncbi:protein of unknown function [Xenorhabdus nematophila AN6/1]|nr:hypothetical protein XNA1_1530004 [Xenorhabdus nematophila str. Anatoliense]CEE94571.1 hypothetical protein XNA1_4720004 [Xenorhabdus nematophila str. Anatoliense]CEF28596.1 hypothetical protein XNW1_1200004 [Xenorhabdus nematophila str. Websteri]CEF31168.1 hypothetical protein XNW1_3190004 [Xenorhabdus nematophila str. Websteri]CEK24100.1 protein of unknown function [Xenorhabdus nematophila AN6/1]
MVTDWHWHTVFSFIVGDPDSLDFPDRLFQRAGDGHPESFRPGYVTCHLADGNDCADYRAY